MCASTFNYTQTTIFVLKSTERLQFLHLRESFENLLILQAENNLKSIDWNRSFREESKLQYPSHPI